MISWFKNKYYKFKGVLSMYISKAVFNVVI